MTQVTEKIHNIRPQRLGKNPVVVLPLEFWEKIEDKLEYLEMMESQALAKKIARVRKEKKLYSSSEVKKMLKI